MPVIKWFMNWFKNCAFGWFKLTPVANWFECIDKMQQIWSINNQCELLMVSCFTPCLSTTLLKLLLLGYYFLLWISLIYQLFLVITALRENSWGFNSSNIDLCLLYVRLFGLIDKTASKIIYIDSWSWWAYSRMMSSDGGSCQPTYLPTFKN